MESSKNKEMGQAEGNTEKNERQGWGEKWKIVEPLPCHSVGLATDESLDVGTVSQ